ncbi:ABC transporter substrate-binding protein [Cellulomonas hominis]
MFSSRTTRRLVAATALISALALAGCSGSGGTNTPTTGGGDDAVELTIFNGASGQIAINFNPFSNTGSTLQPTFGTIYEPLFFYNTTQTGDPEPWLATDFSWNDDSTVLTITLRDGVTWTDGEPFTADDVVFTFNMIRDTPEINTTGFRADAAKVDDLTVTLTYPQPSFFEAPQALGRTYIVPEHLWKDVPDPASYVNEEPVGTGAYELSEFTSQYYVLTKNPEYYVDGKPEVAALRYISLSGNQAALDSFLAGEIDWMSAFVPSIDTVLGGDDNLQWVNSPQNQAALYTCSNAALGCTGPQTDVAVRKAIYYGIDRDQLNALAFDGQNAPISPTFALLGRDDEFISADVEKQAPGSADATAAEGYLIDAGYTKGGDGIYAKDGQRVSLTVQVVTGWTDFISAVDAMAQQLRGIGIELTPQQVSWQEWTDAKGSGNFQLSMDSIAQGAAQDLFFVYNRNFHSDRTAPVGEIANPNYARFSDPTVDAALDELASTSDTARQKDLYAEIQTVIVDQIPYIPVLVNSTLTEFSTAKVEGWPTQDDLYAFPATWANPDAAQVLRMLTVK